SYSRLAHAIRLIMLAHMLLTMMLTGTQAGRPTQAARVTFAVFVTDPSGKPITDVTVTLTGPMERSSRTEAGRLVFENLRWGSYHFGCEKDGSPPLERAVAGRGAAPIDVKVTLTPLRPPPPPIAPVGGLAPLATADGQVVALDIPAFLENKKNYVGHAAGKTTPIACTTGGTSTLIQINDAIATHAHDSADELIYAI